MKTAWCIRFEMLEELGLGVDLHVGPFQGWIRISWPLFKEREE